MLIGNYKHFTQYSQSIATKSDYCVSEACAERSRQIVRTPQRKAKYSDKTRIRLVDIKAIAFSDCKCPDTVEMKRRLKVLGISLDLRLTAAWIAIVWELQDKIKALAITIGDRVIWNYTDTRMCYIERWFPLQVIAIEGSEARLEMLSFSVPVFELSRQK